MASHDASPSSGRLAGGRQPEREIGRGLVGRALAAASIALVTLLAVACIGEPPEVTVDDPELREGRAIYGSACAACHGADGGGGSGSKLSDGAVTAAYPDIADQIELVANGRGQMPAYTGRLTDEQIRAVVRYTREVL